MGCVCVLIVSAQYQVVLLYYGTVYHHDDTLLTAYSCQMIEVLPSYEVPTIRHPPPAVRPVVHCVVCCLPSRAINKEPPRESHNVVSCTLLGRSASQQRARACHCQEFERWKSGREHHQTRHGRCLKPQRCSINGVVVTWVVAIDPPGVRFPLNAMGNDEKLFCLSCVESSNNVQ